MPPVKADLFFSGYLFTVEHLRAWARHHGLDYGTSKIDARKAVYNHGHSKEYISYFHWVEIMNANGEEEEYAMLVTDYMESSQYIDPSDKDVSELLPETRRGGITKQIYDAWIGQFLQQIPELKTIEYRVVVLPRGAKYPVFVIEMKHLLAAKAARATAEAEIAASDEAVADSTTAA